MTLVTHRGPATAADSQYLFDYFATFSQTASGECPRPAVPRGLYQLARPW